MTFSSSSDTSNCVACQCQPDVIDLTRAARSACAYCGASPDSPMIRSITRRPIASPSSGEVARAANSSVAPTTSRIPSWTGRYSALARSPSRRTSCASPASIAVSIWSKRVRANSWVSCATIAASSETQLETVSTVERPVAGCQVGRALKGSLPAVLVVSATTPSVSTTPRISPSTRRALWCGGELGQVYRLDPGSEPPVEVARHGGETRGIAFDADGTAIVCNHVLSAVYRVWPDGRSEELPASPVADRSRRPTTPPSDRRQPVRLRLAGDFPRPTDSSTAGRRGAASRDLPQRAVRLPERPCRRCRAAEWLYVIETAHDAIVRIPLAEPEGPIEPFASGLARMPDGMAFDVEGGSGSRPSPVTRSTASTRTAPVEPSPTTTARSRSTVPRMSRSAATSFDLLFIANLGGNFISVLDAGVAGLPLWGGFRAMVRRLDAASRPA